MVREQMQAGKVKRHNRRRKTMDTAAARHRLTPYTRARREDRPRIDPTRKDEQILLALYQHKLLTAPQIERLLFTPSTRSHCHQRLLKLFQNEYVKRIEQLQLRSEPMKPLVHGLDDLGLITVATLYGCEVGDLEYPSLPHHFKSSDKVDHWIVTNAVLIEVRRAVSQAEDMTLDRWIIEPRLRAWHLRNPRKMPIIPDGVFCLIKDQKENPHFIETDMGTVTIKPSDREARSIIKKVQGYIDYFTSPAYKAVWRTSVGRVLWVTTSEERLGNIKRITEEVGGARRFWFTTQAQVLPGRKKAHHGKKPQHVSENILYAPVWRMATEETSGFSLITKGKSGP